MEHVRRSLGVSAAVSCLILFFFFFKAAIVTLNTSYKLYIP